MTRSDDPGGRPPSDGRATPGSALDGAESDSDPAPDDFADLAEVAKIRNDDPAGLHASDTDAQDAAGPDVDPLETGASVTGAALADETLAGGSKSGSDPDPVVDPDDEDEVDLDLGFASIGGHESAPDTTSGAAELSLVEDRDGVGDEGSSTDVAHAAGLEELDPEDFDDLAALEAINRLHTAPGIDLSELSPPEEGDEAVAEGLHLAPPSELTAEMVAARPVVSALVVARDPGPWFTETLASLGAQDYGRVEVTVIDGGTESGLAGRVAAVLPDAEVLEADHELGFGALVDQVVAGMDEGAFLFLCTDDVAPAPDAVRLLVEETFRSNGGIVGPKLVTWDDPNRILSVGMTSDKFAEPSPIAVTEELDQEQHDAVRDVLVIEAGATLIRYDLFNEIGGFDPGIDRFGEAQTICWRAHAAGARVLMVPGAQVRSRRSLEERLPDADQRHREARHQLRNMLSNYGPVNLVLLLPQLMILHIVEALRSASQRDFGRASQLARAWTWNLSRLSSIKENRAEISAYRRVGDREVRSLQVRGSTALRSMTGESTSVDNWSEKPGDELTETLGDRERIAAIVAITALVVVHLIGSRQLIGSGVSAIGEFAPYSSSATELVGRWASGWRANGLGSEGIASPALGLLGLAGWAGLGQTGLVRTVLILGLLPIGWLGTWRTLCARGTRRSAVVGTVAYGVLAPAHDAIAMGSWTSLAVYAALPWIVHATWASVLGEPITGAATRPRTRPTPELLVAGAAPIGLLWAVVPGAPIWVVMVALSAMVAAVFNNTLRTSLRRCSMLLAMAGVAALVLAPWVVHLATSGSWASLLGGSTGSRSTSLASVISLDVGPMALGFFAWSLPLAALAALAVCRGDRLALTIDGWTLVLVSWAAACTAELGWWPVPAPATTALLMPACLGVAMAIAAGSTAARDLSTAGFSWRQPIGLAGVILAFAGVLPFVTASLDGRWEQPSRDLSISLSGLSSPDAPAPRVLWIGDADLLPVQSRALDDGVAYAVTGPSPDLSEWFLPASTDATEVLETGFDAAVDGSTTRFGRLLGDLGVRWVAVPTRTAPGLTEAADRPLPGPYADALDAQLDLVESSTSASLTLYRNQAWAPVARVVDPVEGDSPSVESTESVQATVLASLRQPVPAGARGVPVDGESSQIVELATGGSNRWTVQLDGEDLDTERSSALLHSAVLDRPGRVTVSHSTSWWHRIWSAFPILLSGGLLIWFRRRTLAARSRAVDSERAAPDTPGFTIAAPR